MNRDLTHDIWAIMREAYPKRDDERESLLKPQREEYLPTPPIRL